MKKSIINSFSKIKVTIIVTLMSLFITSLNAQQISSDDLLVINGNWEGKLIYVDYGDDKTQYALNTKLEANWGNGKGKLKFEFKEPNGKLVYSTEKIKLISTEEFMFDGKWEIISFENAESSWKLILETNGKDNNKESTLREEISYQESSLTINKMVKYDGMDSFFLRNSYSLNKVN
ncbi:MAG: hypothetical protein AB8B73_01500 [Ekhidna sp.]